MVARGHSRQAGFTLMEVLVAGVIAAISATVFFQLFSSGMRLEVRARELMEESFQVRWLFQDLLQRDIQDDDFPWEGAKGDLRWQVRLMAVEVQGEQSDEAMVVRLPLELYRVELTLTFRPGAESRVSRYVTFAPGTLTEDFKSRRLGS